MTTPTLRSAAQSMVDLLGNPTIGRISLPVEVRRQEAALKSALEREPNDGLQKLTAAYQHFTLEEWKFLTSCVLLAVQQHRGGKMDKAKTLLAKFPSAVL